MSLIRKQNTWFPSLIDEFLNTDWNINSMDYSNTHPAVNIKESDKKYCLDIAAPGLNKDNIEVSYENKILSIEVVNNNKNENIEFNRFEFDYNSFKRSFKLPDSIDLSKIDASYVNGVLSINLPKKKEAQTQPKKLIKIK
ncbi:MAG: heat-shock protein Hsp20 [Flavobacteriaceae bacterium]|nr:heat-shock protein Hsp20 [Flavobacteriaceae bacterium]|tara:strand:- start:1733 stop:2152 length:420 start_codon:yes stop_codon:yes gene_type:complete